MFTEDFAIDGATGTLQQRRASRAILESTQYLYALQQVYPALKDISQTAGVIMFGEVQPFIDVALHMQTFIAPDFTHENGNGPKALPWPKPGASAEAVNAAFLYYLDHKPLFEQLKTIWERLDLPNGKAGASPEQLAEAEHADPLSGTSASSTSGDSANG